jgi:hypothetical protein
LLILKLGFVGLKTEKLLNLLKWELKVEKGDLDFHQISKTIKEEVKRFDLERVREFKVKLTNYLEGLLASQEQVISSSGFG